jgi:acetyltransferase-like isoleucine patch superfamily enzyme
MIFSNIELGENVEIDPSSSFNNIKIGHRVKIAKRCSLFGSAKHALEIGDDSYIGMNTLIEGYGDKVVIGAFVSIAPNVHIMSSSGPNASKSLQKVFPIVSSPVEIGDHCWVGAGAVIMPGVKLGKYCVVAVNSFVNVSFKDFVVIGGTPARVIRQLTPEEIKRIEEND